MKQNLRVWAKEERKKFNTMNLSKILLEKLKSSDEYINSKNIMIYYPLPYEIDLLGVLDDTSKKFYLPKISGNELLCCSYKEGDNTCLSVFHTVEPLTMPEDASIIDLVIVPALCVDKNNYRLGYGGGYYDRFLKKCTAKTVVCISKQLLINTIYPEPFDIPIDRVITD